MSGTANKRVLMLALCILPFTRCTSDTDLSAGFGSETTNGITAVVVHGDGAPAIGALVRIRPVDYLQPLAVDKARFGLSETTTDSAGRFAIDSIDAGRYRIEITDRDSSAVLIDIDIDAFIDAGEHVLTRYAAVTGRVEPDAYGAHQYVQVYGLERLAGVGADGSYVIDDLPGGAYRLRIIAGGASTAAQTVDSVVAVPGDTATVPLYAPWRHSKKVRFNTSLTGANVAETVHGFPALVRLSRSTFDFGQADSLGADVRFATPLGSPIPYEIESWDAASGQAAIWVRVDTLHGNSDTQYVALLWGNPAATDRSGPSRVFDTSAGFAGVWHLEGDNDATANRNDGAANGPVTQGGIIGGAQWFDGIDDFIDCGAGASLTIAGDLTISAWVRLGDATADRYMRIVTNKPDISQIPGYELECNPSHLGQSYMTLFTGGPTEYARSHAGPWAQDQWHYCVAALRGSVAALFRNGEELRAQPDSILAPPVAGTDALRIGGWNGDYFFGGIDEVRISRVARSPAWARLCYENQKPSQTLVTLE